MKTPAVPSVSAARSPRSTQRQVARSSQQATRATLDKARALVNQTASRLAQARTAHEEQAHSLSNTRLVDQICAELNREFAAPDAAPRAANHPLLPGTTQAPVAPVATVAPSCGSSAAGVAPQVDAAAKAQAAVELIEQIETFVRSQRPGLSLTLNSSLGARVEIERTGKREVALKLTGQHRPPNTEDLSRIRDALRTRGLNVSALSVA